MSTASAVSRPIVAVVGDSYTAGFGSDGTCGRWNYGGAWWNYTAADLGWQVGSVVADPGGGFQHPGQFGTLAQQLAAHPIGADTNFVIVQAGTNDFNGDDPAREMAAVRAFMDLLHSQAPNAVPVVIGAFAPQSTLPTPTALVIARDISDPVAIGWDTRYIIGVIARYEQCGDGTHPDAYGHQQIGHWASWHLEHFLDGGNLLRYDAAGGYWTV